MFNTVAVYQDAVFGFGGNRSAGFLHCTNFADGRLLWKEASREWTKDQNLVIADGLIFSLTKSGDLVMAEATRDRYHELGRVASGHGTWGARSNRPSLTAGCIFAVCGRPPATRLPSDLSS